MTDIISKNVNLRKFFHYFDWDKTKTFYYVAQAGNFTKSAKFLCISQPALSRQIASLENRLGYLLFVRQTQGLTLTRKGEELYRIIAPIFIQLQKFAQESQKKPRGEKRTLRIGINKSLFLLISEALKTYQRSHSYLTFELVEDLPSTNMTVLDLDIVFRPLQSDSKDLLQRPLIQVDKSLLSSKPVIISSTPAKQIDLYFITPAYLKDDEEIEDIYKALLSSIRKEGA